MYLSRSIERQTSTGYTLYLLLSRIKEHACTRVFLLPNIQNQVGKILVFLQRCQHQAEPLVLYLVPSARKRQDEEREGRYLSRRRIEGRE